MLLGWINAVDKYLNTDTYVGWWMKSGTEAWVASVAFGETNSHYIALLPLWTVCPFTVPLTEHSFAWWVAIFPWEGWFLVSILCSFPSIALPIWKRGLSKATHTHLLKKNKKQPKQYWSSLQLCFCAFLVQQDEESWAGASYQLHSLCPYWKLQHPLCHRLCLAGFLALADGVEMQNKVSEWTVDTLPWGCSEVDSNSLNSSWMFQNMLWRIWQG